MPDARCLNVGADRVGELAVAGVAQRNVENDGDDQEDGHGAEEFGRDAARGEGRQKHGQWARSRQFR